MRRIAFTETGKRSAPCPGLVERLKLYDLRANPKVGILFIDFEKPRRLRVNGTAVVSTDDPLMPLVPGAPAIVRGPAHHIFPNCPRYIHKMQIVEASPYVPEDGVVPPVPAWKTFDIFEGLSAPWRPGAAEGWVIRSAT
jgi:hypothetical protein